MKKFRVGQIVTIRKDMKEGGTYKVYCNRKMVQLRGNKVKILGVSDNAYGGFPRYSISGIGSEWIWTHDMFGTGKEVLDLSHIKPYGIVKFLKDVDKGVYSKKRGKK